VSVVRIGQMREAVFDLCGGGRQRGIDSSLRVKRWVRRRIFLSKGIELRRVRIRENFYE